MAQHFGNDFYSVFKHQLPSSPHGTCYICNKNTITNQIWIKCGVEDSTTGDGKLIAGRHSAVISVPHIELICLMGTF